MSGCIPGCLIFGIATALLAIFFIFPALQKTQAVAVASKGCLHAAAIVRALEEYAAAHQGAYPPGKSSTDIFQILLNDHYLDDPGIFYLPMLGKTKAETKQLKLENVCWDITTCPGSTLAEGVPFVFSTGYKVT